MSGDRILVVDDDPVSRRSVRRLAEREGYTVLEAGTGEQALELLETAQPAVMLLDVLLPGLDGFAVTAEVRRRPSLRGLPIVLITSLGDRSSRVRGLQAGADEFLSKPVDPAELTARLRSLLRLRWFQALSAQQELLEAAFEGLSDGLVIAEPGGRVVAANPPARRLLDLPDDPSGEDLLARLRRFRAEPPLDALLAAPQGAEGELHRESGPELILACSLARVADDEGRPLYRTLALRDVTEARAAARLRADYLALTAHKIRTPITILRGLVELVTAEPASGAELLADLGPDLLDKLADIADIVANLSALATSGERHRSWPAESSLLNAAVDRAVVRMVERFPGRPPRLRGDLPALEIALPPSDLGLILGELLHNAVRFGPPSGPRIDVEARLDSRLVVLTLTDDGQGIPREAAERVFEVCYQVGGNDTGRAGGLGLGLALVRRTLAAYGGEIRLARSAPGEGSTFELRLPLATRPEPVSA